MTVAGEPGEDAIKRADLEPDSPRPFHRLRHAVGVARSVGQGEQHLEIVRWQREQNVVGVAGRVAHDPLDGRTLVRGLPVRYRYFGGRTPALEGVSYQTLVPRCDER